MPKRRVDHDAGGEGRALPQVVIDQLLSDAYLDRLREGYGEDIFVMLQVLADTGRRPDELAKLMATCLDRTEFIDEQTGELQSGWVLVHDMPKVAITNFRLFIARSTAELIIAQRDQVVARFPSNAAVAAALVSAQAAEPRGRLGDIGGAVELGRAALGGRPAGASRPDRRAVPARARDPVRVSPQLRAAARGQRHADRRAGSDDGPPHDRHDPRLLQGQQGADAQGGRDRVGDAAQPPRQPRRHRAWESWSTPSTTATRSGRSQSSFGTCHEPSNVKSSGQACPYRFRCFGCTHFRTDPSYLPELREHLQRLLADHERLNAVTDGMLEDWARRDALPAPQEIVAVRRLIRAAEGILDGLTAEERASVDELFAVIRRARANIETALPTHFSAVVRQPQPTLYPQPARAAAAS